MNLKKYEDLEYKKFNSALIPGIENMIGIRVPILRKISKEMTESEKEEFLQELPHKYHEENMIHMLILKDIKDYEKAYSYLLKFIPYIENWQVSDVGIPVAFKDREKSQKTLKLSKELISRKSIYSMRYGVFILMRLFLDEFYDKEVLEIVANIKTEEYYVNMMRSWFFQNAIEKRYSDAIVYLEEKKLDRFTHLKTISKCIDSRKIDENIKVYLKTLR